MPEILRMPEIAANTTEAVLASWVVPEGGAFAEGDTLVAVELEKATVDVPAGSGGVLLRHLVDEGTTVEVGSPIALLGAVGELVEDVDRALIELGVDVAMGVGTSSADALRAALADEPVPRVGRGVAMGQRVALPGGRTFASPVARRLAHEQDVELTDVTGTGPAGRIRKRDVEEFIAGRTGPTLPAPVSTPALTPAAAPAPAANAPAPAAPRAPVRVTGAGPAITFPAGADEVLVPLTQMRKGIAAQMTRALGVPHAYVTMEVDATNLVRLREAAKHAYREREGISLSLVPFVVKACVEALRRHPTLNAHWTEGGLLAKRRLNIGVAVAVEEGLIVPVVRDVDGLSISGLNRAIADVAARARAGRLRVDDFGGGTFTLDNTGWLGSQLTMPIINVPEVAIVTMEQIRKRPVVVETPDGDVIAIRPVMNMVLGIDHRANDGAGGAAFLRDVKAWLEAVGPETPIY